MHRPAWSFLGSPHETEKIVRQGGDAKKHERRSTAACPIGVHPSLMSVSLPSSCQYRIIISLS